MRIPVTINLNTLKTYEGRFRNQNNKLKSGYFNWDEAIPRSLQEICLETIAENWKYNPLLEEIVLLSDKTLLLNTLPVALPLRLTIPIIEDDIYWKRCYVTRWPKQLPIIVNDGAEVFIPSSHRDTDSPIKSPRCLKKTWKHHYLEMHVREYLEKLKPEDYDAEKMKELSDLCETYVRILVLRELQCSEDSPNRIPLNSVLTGFQNLTELSLCFKQTYAAEKFCWNTLKVAVQDANLLAKGLEKCNLTIFRIQNSDIDDDKLTTILKALIKHDNLKILGVSHCRVSDRGAIALSKFSLLNSIEDLIINNNNIGVKGVEALCYAIGNNCCNLQTLNLKLNPIRECGGELLMEALSGGTKLTSVLLNGCGLTKNNISIGKMLEENSGLEFLDLSNNKLGEEVGKAILNGLQYNRKVKKLDVRMCNLSARVEFEILLKLGTTKKKTPKQPMIIEPKSGFTIPDKLLLEIDHVFETSHLD